MINSLSYLRVVRASGWYDLVVTAGFATPWTYALVHDLLSTLGTMPARETMQTLYANLMGSVIVVWALLRVIRPVPLHGLLDGVARALFSTWFVSALAHGATGVLWLFLAVEVTFGVAQLVPWSLPGRRRLSLTTSGTP